MCAGENLCARVSDVCVQVSDVRVRVSDVCARVSDVCVLGDKRSRHSGFFTLPRIANERMLELSVLV
jgi:hypothetical protein